MAKAEIDDLEIFLDNAKGILQKSMILLQRVSAVPSITKGIMKWD